MHGGGRRRGRARRERPRLRPVAQEIVRRRGAAGSEREAGRTSGEGVWVLLVLPLADEKSWRWRGAGAAVWLGSTRPGEKKATRVKKEKRTASEEKGFISTAE